MATRGKIHRDHISHYVFHHGLVNLFVLTKLRKQYHSWKHFLFWSGFELETPETKNYIKVHINSEEVEISVTQRKIKGKNTRGHKRKVEQEIKNPESEFNSKDDPILEPIQKELQKKVLYELQNVEITVPDNPKDA